MSKRNSANAAVLLQRRIEKAQREQRWKEALELAQSLNKQGNTEENRLLLRSAALGFARSLGERNSTRDLAKELPRLSVLFPDDAAWALQLAEIVARYGLVAEGIQLLPQGDAVAEARLHGILADATIQRGSAGGAGLSPEMQADHLRILNAFGFVEKGQDNQARDELQGVGLRSPFAEWRLFLRGLMAYHAKDDEKAIQAWERLAADRIPFRLAAPLRQQIDPTFRNSQTPETQLALNRQARKLQPRNPLADALYQLQQGILHQEGSLASEFAALRTLKPQLAALAPSVRDRLSRSIYWSLLQAPEDVQARYLKVFSPPTEDPSLHRLRALDLEHQRGGHQALECWLLYESEIAANRTLWGNDSDRVRALIWLHAGVLASDPTEESAVDEFLSILGGHLHRPGKKSRKPEVTPEDCFLRARTLGPDLVDAYAIPLIRLCAEEKYEEARPLADDLRQRFPENVDAQMTAAAVYRDLEDLPTAIACVEQAIRINPLAGEFRAARASYARALVMQHLHAGRTAEATEALAQARAWTEAPDQVTALELLEATLAWKSGDLAPIEKIRKDLESTLPAVAVLYTLVVQANVANLDRKTRAKIDKEFKEKLDGKLTLPEAMALGGLIVQQGEQGSTPYRGFKTHQTKVIKKLEEAATDAKLSAREYLELGVLYCDLKASRPLAQMIPAMPRQYPRIVHYYLLYLKDAQEIKRRSHRFLGPPVYYLNFVEQYAPSLKDRDLQTFIQQRLDRHRAEWDMDTFRNPFDHLYDRFDEDFDEEEMTP